MVKKEAPKPKKIKPPPDQREAPKLLKKALAKAPPPSGKRTRTLPKNPGGRPTLYEESFDKRARNICLLMNANDEELADYFEVNPTTIHDWKVRHPSFASAIKSGKKDADASVAASLNNLAIGYEYEEDDIKTVGIGIGLTEIAVTRVRRYQPPNVAAQSIWLRNRQREYWRNDPHAVGTNSTDATDIARAAREAIAAADDTSDEGE